MLAKVLLPLLLMASAVAGNETEDVCRQLIQKINYIQDLVPIQVGVNFPHSRFVSGHAKFRIVPGLTVDTDSGCSTVQHTDLNSRLVTIKVKSGKAYVTSPTKILIVNEPTYTLSLNVEDKKPGSVKRVTVSDFKFENKGILEDSSAVPPAFQNFVNQNLQASIQKELVQKLNTEFDTNKLVEINGNLVKRLMLNVFKAAAQDM